jgi:hypothetical protein
MNVFKIMMGVHWDWMTAYIYDLLGLVSVTIKNYSDYAI